MDTGDAIKSMLIRTDTSQRAASLAMGRSGNFLGATFAKQSTCSAATVAEVGRVCGYTLALVPDRDVPAGAIVIDPPR